MARSLWGFMGSVRGPEGGAWLVETDLMRALILFQLLPGPGLDSVGVSVFLPVRQTFCFASLPLVESWILFLGGLPAFWAGFSLRPVGWWRDPGRCHILVWPIFSAVVVASRFRLHRSHLASHIQFEPPFRPTPLTSLSTAETADFL